MPKKTSNFLTLRRFNYLLAIVVCLLAGYIMLIPFWPAVSWWAKYEVPVLASTPSVQVEIDSAEEIPTENLLIIPSLGLREKIHEGPTIRTLRYGVWLRPQASTPDKGSNTVLAGHRFTYAGQAVFYHLDKVKADDAIYIWWGGKRYEYKVNKLSVVPANQVSIEAPSSEAKVTIYTCTPLWAPKERLVIEAEQMENR